MNKTKDLKIEENLENKKKPYKKPEIISEKIFETMALQCGKCEAIGPFGFCWAGTQHS